MEASKRKDGTCGENELMGNKRNTWLAVGFHLVCVDNYTLIAPCIFRKG